MLIGIVSIKDSLWERSYGFAGSVLDLQNVINWLEYSYWILS